MKFTALLASLAGLALSVPSLAAADAPDAQHTPSGAMLRYPDVSKDRICFVFANDIWTVAKGGGDAVPLASPPGQESFPRFSADGQTIAFVGNYDGNRDIYTIPLTGGIPTRVTHHPAGESLADWTPDGKLLFLTNGLAGLARQTQLFTVPATGGLPEQIPVPYGGFGAISPDGTWLAYTPHSTDTRTWKRYRGGMATDIWLFNLKDKTSKKITDWEGTDTIPMWVPGSDGSVLYYLSDNGPEHRLNIWSYTIKDGKRAQVTTFKEDDVRWPSVGPGDNGKGEIVFQLGSELRLLDLATKKDKAIKVMIPGDKPTLRPKAVDAAKHISSATLSPTGKRVVIEARGDLWSAPAKEGVTRNLTHSDGTFERSPSWSPDGKWIAFFSDESGEYELWLRPSDGRLPEEKPDKKGDLKGDKKTTAKTDEKATDKKDADKKDDAAKDDDEPKPEPKSAMLNIAPPKKLTNLGPGFRYNPTWSPDSKHINFTDKAGNLYLLSANDKGEWSEPKLIDTDPQDSQLNATWSYDSNWLAYSRGDEDSKLNRVTLYNLKTDKKTAVTSPMFSSQNPAFDRKGEYLYFTSNRSVENPVYGDIDGSFVYTATELMYVVPLRKDLKSPFAAKSDEEELKKDDKKEDKKDGDKADKSDKKDDDAKKDDKSDPKKEDKKPAEHAQAEDAVSGSWDGKATSPGEGFPPEGVAFGLKLTLKADGSVTGTSTSHMGNGTVDGTFDKATGSITLNVKTDAAAITLSGTVKGESMSGGWSSADGLAKGDFTANRTAKASGGGDGDKPKSDKSDKADKSADKKDKPKEVKIDLEGFERRAIQLPLPSGAFGNLQVNNDNKLIYLRAGGRRGGGEAAIKIFDLTDDTHEEKTVTPGGGGFELSADGKKMMIQRGSSITIMDPVAGGGKSTTVPTSGMKTTVDPRAEWHQIFNDAWRLERDFFYEPTMHGVDWPKMREHYGAMIDDCANREDVAWVIGELISELNIGHAYVTSPGEVESQPSVAVGMLGCDFILDGPAYKIRKIYEGGAWDADARGPLSQPGINVHEGDYLLAVNGVPVDTRNDPWAAFVDTADRPTTITVSKNPTLDDQARDVLLKPMGNETALRTRAWIEHNRKYVEDKSGGKVGYIYVPNTGVDGQNELFRQFLGQRGKAALIIDERWNGGGQIPTRFIELLNRPVTNYWAKRDGQDWTWPPDSHQGPKCMLINGLAGSGGDAFPFYFKEFKLGKTIGMRTWGGLVGISGNPGLIDGGAITVPTFGFYKTNGTWGVEGHGVDPDIEVVDDPAKMQNGGDPQLDRAIEQMEQEIKTHPYTPPKRPVSPDRSGMGSKPEDR